MKTKTNTKKYKAAAAIVVAVAAMILISGPTIIADNQDPQDPLDLVFMGTVSINFTATDNITGVDFTMVRVDFDDGNGYMNGTFSEFTGAFQLSIPGDYKVHYYSVDKAGNVETVKVTEFRLLEFDDTPPNTEIHIIGQQIE